MRPHPFLEAAAWAAALVILAAFILAAATFVSGP